MRGEKFNRRLGIGFLALLVNSAYIAAYASPTIFYIANVLLHLVLGLALAGALAVLLFKNAEVRRSFPAGATLLFAAATLLGAFLALSGATNANRWALIGHIGAAGLGVAVLAAAVWRRTQWRGYRRPLTAAVALLAIWPLGAELYRRAFPDPSHRIRNPELVPVSMEEEGGGPKSPFFPSSAVTNTGGLIPSDFFMNSDVCGTCHKDIYEQWRSSAHRFGSFNNQFYRKSIEYMQSVAGTQPSKWCAGCHDHAVFFNGRFDKPIKDQIDTPEAQAGLACTSCHSIVHVQGSMGNGGFTIKYPPLHELAGSRNQYIRMVDKFLTYLDPEPHRQTFMKPFMRADSAEFCSSCHKVHLDVPVNQYRWFRGFNDYDAWQASGMSGQGARSFYYPQKSQTCTDCHMPLVDSRDPGNRGGKVHSHRFPAANTALAWVNRDPVQYKTTEEFLKNGVISVDIFAASPVEDDRNETAMVRRSGEGPQIMTGFATGEEAMQAGHVTIRDIGRVAAPIDRSGVALKPGSTARVDVVVRTRRIGHFFPAGTVDAFDVWLELQAKDASGKVFFWSGRVEDGGRGPVESGAHFYRSYQLDGQGNPINKRNAWQARSVLYVRLIPPGAADVAHFRIRIPENAQGPLTLHAKVNYRKFAHYYTQFAYAGEPQGGSDPALVGAAFDSRKFTFSRDDVPKNVSGAMKGEIPDLPIVVVAEADARIPLGEPAWKPVAQKQDRERWNDWGIGLLLQGDLKAAEFAFRKVTEAEPGYADGWLNVARTLIQEGQTEAARPFIRKALDLDPGLARVHFFKGLIEKSDGDYDAALASLKKAASLYPRDRVVANQIGRVLFLKRDYAGAIQALRRVREVDPEDLQMHYTLMLAYRGLGDLANAEREEKLFRRFKAEESAQALTARQRQISPEDNNERQMIHDHESAPLPPGR